MLPTRPEESASINNWLYPIILSKILKGLSVIAYYKKHLKRDTTRNSVSYNNLY